MNYESSSRRPTSRQSSPIPRRQLGSLSVNQRSYSRLSSKGALGDDSVTLSPLPVFSKGRSVTFGEAEYFREERPHYNAAYSSTRVSPTADRRPSPPPASILKTNTSTTSDHNAANPSSNVSKSKRVSPVPVRGRSASRQRLAAKKREAQLMRGFYDDSFVEEFVLSTKDELEREEKSRQIQNVIEKEKETVSKAEEKFVEANSRLDALQRAKDILLDKRSAKRDASASLTPTKRRRGKSNTEVRVDKELEDDSDPEIQSALAAIDSKRKRSRRNRRGSVPIVAESAFSDDDDDSNESVVRKAKLEKIVSSILSEQRKSKSKRSVVVINFSDSDDDDEEGPIRVKTRRAPAVKKSFNSSSRKASANPSLGNSLLLEDESDEPILLQRPKKRKVAVTRSLSNFNELQEELPQDYSEETIVRKPPARTKQAAKKPAPNTSGSFASGRRDPYVNTTRRARPAPVPKVSSDDPMAVFFNAAFPSPSKFDEMISRAGGISDTRRGNRGQSNLVLPDSISKRR
ncbi:hypothetical protein, conserved [Angomonas deanei]|uniref:Uncharacterized protein n=1 Tax=Angomonas deanei TaxID=59799 RepID=A0A7G2C956_9TRYP|nr:hypothetical protein, conserved [Angomonas deanei]